jgi:UDP-GlcNAc:undecaprenyl-phosphate GlcNAc-1-phosphate transferase
MFLLLVLSVSYFCAAGMLHVLVNSPLTRLFGDVPNHRKVHQQIVPRLGGLGMILAFGIVFALRTQVPDPVWPRSGNHLSLALLFIAVFLAGTGALDDARNLNFKIKFVFQFALAAGVTLLLGHHFGRVSLFGHFVDLNQFGALATVFWIVAVMNAFNIIDGIDGLAGGVAICGFGAAAMMAYSNGAGYLLAMNIVFIGLTLGFLRFNFSRRYKVFLGDAGSQFLGAVLALMAIEAQRLPKSHASILVPLLVVGYPLFDISVAMARRFLKGGGRSLRRRFGRMFVADNEHLHHRLVYLGLTHGQSTFLLVTLAASFSTTSVIIVRLPIPGRIGVLAYLGVALFLILNRLGYVGLNPWLTFPRVKQMPGRIVGVIEPDEVFFHSLTSFKQDKFEFLNMPSRMSKFMGADLVAVMVYNASGEKFEERWSTALRATEYHDCPAIVIADPQDIAKVKSTHNGEFKSIHFMEKPIRVPELVRELEKFSRIKGPAAVRPREKTFSLAAIALRNSARS